MKCYVIKYFHEGNEVSEDKSDKIQKTIEKSRNFGGIRVTKNFWVVNTELTANEINKELSTNFQGSDVLYTFEVTKNSSFVNLSSGESKIVNSALNNGLFLK